MKISRGNIRDGRPNERRALLTFGILQAFQGGLEVETHGVLPEWSLQQETLKRTLGGGLVGSIEEDPLGTLQTAKS